MNVAELQAARAKSFDIMAALGELDVLTPAQVADYDKAKADVKAYDEQIERKRETQAMMAKAARPVGSGVAAQVKNDPYEKDPSLIIGAMIKMVAKAKGDVIRAFDYAEAAYGASHPVTEAMGQSKALNTATGSAGGFVVPPDFVDYIIPLLYAKTVVRRAGALVQPMPNGTMSIPKMTGGSAAYWIGEAKAISESAPTFGQVVATAHKLAALVPISNDQMRYATPQFDGMVRNDLAMQIALAEDAAAIRGAGTAYSPKGLLTYCLASQTIASNPNYTTATVNNELAGAITRLELANLPLEKVGWLMSPRTKNYLLNIQNANGFYIYREEMTELKTLLGYPFFTTTQIPINLVVGPNADCSEIYLCDFGETMILESRQLEFAISTEGVYVDANGQMQSAFQNDLTIIRGIMAEDFQLRHDQAVAIITGVRWSPSLS
jgi:HK97 family phage major capsid protein